MRFQVYGMVMKYAQIYRSHSRSRNLNISVSGPSHNEIVANAAACAVIPHTLIDNAVKYSPRDEKIEVCAEDDGDGVFFSVSSFGPRLRPGERNRIFEPFYRGKEAIRMAAEGAGYGLYVSQLVAKRHLGTSISVFQDPRKTSSSCVWTKFSLRFPERATIMGVATESEVRSSRRPS